MYQSLTIIISLYGVKSDGINRYVCDMLEQTDSKSKKRMIQTNDTTARERKSDA